MIGGHLLAKVLDVRGASLLGGELSEFYLEQTSFDGGAEEELIAHHLAGHSGSAGGVLRAGVRGLLVGITGLGSGDLRHCRGVLGEDSGWREAYCSTKESNLN